MDQLSMNRHDAAPAITAQVCIIGAGVSGLTAAKALKDAGIPFECLEKGSGLGGMWRYENDSGTSSAYRSLHIDSSRQSISFPDFPVPADLPDYLSHRQVLQHLENYAEHFGILPNIRFATPVVSVAPAPDGGWEVTTEPGGVRQLPPDVIVANGHLWDPKLPEFPGHIRRHPDALAPLPRGGPLRGQDGARGRHRQLRGRHRGRSRPARQAGAAIDPAQRLDHAEIHHGGPHRPLARRDDPPPEDARGGGTRPPAPCRAPRHRQSGAIRRAAARPSGVARTRDHEPGTAALHRPRLDHREAQYRTRLDGEEIAFLDGSRETVDAIIYATGYRASFPFLDPAIFRVEDGRPPALYRRIVAVDHPSLFFAGLVQPIGPTITLVEVQARWMAAVLAGRIALPDRDTMMREVERHRARVAARYVNAARYTLEVDFRDYVRDLIRDMQRQHADADSEPA
jgi:dimethylaniline monooxygenase (N-oxide forming)